MQNKIEIGKKNGNLIAKVGKQIFELDKDKYGDIAALFLIELMKDVEMLELGKLFVVVKLEQD